MSHDAKEIANLLLDWAEDEAIEITPMKLQKLLYFCHADFLRINGKPLITQEFEAWEYGPVLPGVFSEFKKFSKASISGRAYKFDPVIAAKVLATPNIGAKDVSSIRLIYDFYKWMSATSLSELSHAEEGPWEAARRLFELGQNPDRRISNSLIHRYYAKLRATD